jgi:3-deoxy-D-manno-octulosonate 8-phosphate phosphatase (KDO 8-P phosphatase)
MNHDKCSNIKLMLFDVDGVLTDGGIIYDGNGEELKVFNVRDGLGIRLLMKAGVMVGIVTGRSSKALRHRCENLGISLVFQGVRDKGILLDQIIQTTGYKAEEIAFMGDDLPDLPIMRKVGFSIAVANAHESVLKQADMITAEKGGAGAAREVCEKIIKSRGLWEDLLKQYF